MGSLPARLRPLPWVADLLLALLVAWFQVRGTQLVGPPGQLARLGEPPWLGYLLLAGSGLVLAVRRRWPVPVLVVVAAANAGYYLGHYPDGPSWTALFVALFTVTAEAGRPGRARVAAATIAALSAVWLATADLSPLLGAGWVFFRIGTAVMAAALGESVRARRIITADAVARAELAERTREEEARARVDAERLRIAREIHDTVAHAIAVINVQAGMTAHVLDRQPDRARDVLTTIERASARALADLRTTLAMLRDADGSARPGLDRLPELAKVAADAGMDVHVEAAGLPHGLPADVDQAAYRILQEAVTNAIRHAGPARVDIRVAVTGGRLAIEVGDDGAGPDAAAAGPGPAGHGLDGMRERCALLGGGLQAGPDPRGGFRVRAWLPVPADHPAGAVAP